MRQIEDATYETLKVALASADGFASAMAHCCTAKEADNRELAVQRAKEADAHLEAYAKAREELRGKL